MSAEERLAALLEHLGYGDTTDRLTGGPDVYQEWGMTPREFAARLIAAGVRPPETAVEYANRYNRRAGVSVPTDPGAPDHAAHIDFRATAPAICPICRSRPVPAPEPSALAVPGGWGDLLPAAPEPSARLREVLGILDVIDAIVDDTHPEGDGCPLCRALDDLRAVRAATPQDPEA